jgi:hypothetical protein
MRVVLEIHSGPSAGKKAWLRSGQRIVIGRTEGSECVIPHDGQLSGRHFAIECSIEKCLVRDLGSSNGTFLNGQKVEEAVVQGGDLIVAGQTTFAIRIEDAAPIAPPLVLRPELVAQQSSALPAAALASMALPPKSTTSPMPKRPPSISIPKPFDAGVIDVDPAVRGAALLAAAWTRQQWLLEYCRTLAQTPAPDNWDGIRLLAILGKPSDLPRILAIGKLAALGPARFQVLATFGHPEVVEPLLKSMRGPDPEDAIAAGTAFTKITRVELDSVPPEPSAVERAWEHWKRVRGRFSSGSRWRRGIDVSQPLSAEVLEQIDLESRWEACLRGNYEGTWNGTLMDLEEFPQRRR